MKLLHSLLLVPFVYLGTAAGQTITATKDDNLPVGQRKVVGDNITYTITIGNAPGAPTATGVQFTDPDPANTTFVSLFTTPIARNDSYTATGNINIAISAAAGLLANDSDPDGVGPALTVTASSTTTQGGTLAVNSDGSFTYDPPAGFVGTDTFTYTLHDNDTDGGGHTDTATVTINVSGIVWFIRNNGGGSNKGTFTNPFTSLAAFNAANTGAALKPSDGDYIVLRTGSGGYVEADGINLRNQQKLIGEAVRFDTVFTASANSSAAYKTFASSTNAQPGISTTAGNGIDLALDNTVRGISINNTPGFYKINGGAVGSPVINFVGLFGTGGAINISTSGAFGSNVLIQSVTSTSSPGANLNLVGVTGTLSITAASGLSGSAAGSPAINVSGGNVSFNYPNDVRKDTAGPLLNVTGGHTGTLTFTNATSNASGLAATAGTGLQFDNADGTYNFNGVATTLNGGDAGVDILNGSSGTFNFTATAAITSPSGPAFNVSASNPTITYAGTITQNNAARAVQIQNGTGGTITFSGAITAGVNSAGIFLDNNDQGPGGASATVNFTGGMSLGTGANPAFTATGGGTVSATQNNSTIVNTLATSTGTALNVTNTTIGPSGLTFRSISANGAANGIVLNNTGSSAGLTVTGVGTTAGSGGTITGTTSDGARFTSAVNISLKNMNFSGVATSDGAACDNLTNSGCNAAIGLYTVTGVTLDNITINGTGEGGINGVTVTNFSLANSTVTNTGNAPNEHGVRFTNLLGTSSINNSTVRNSAERNMQVDNNTGNLTLTISNSVLRDSATFNSSTNPGDGLLFVTASAAQVKLNINNTDFINHRSMGAQIGAKDTSHIRLTLDGGSAFQENYVQLNLNTSQSGRLTFKVDGNTFTTTTLAVIGPANDPAPPGTKVNVFASGDSTVHGQISNNTISSILSDTQDAGIGIRVNNNETADTRVQINNNNVSVPVGAAIDVQSRSANNTALVGRLDAIVQNNTATVTGANNGFQGIFGRVQHAHTICGAITGNNASSGSVDGIRVVKASTSGFQLQGYSGDGSAANVASFLDAQNGPTTGTITASGTGFTGGACLAPDLTPLSQPLLFRADGSEAVAQSTARDGDSNLRDALGSGTASAFTPNGASNTEAAVAATALASVAPAATDDAPLRQAQLDVLVEQAITRWEATGLTAEQLAALRAIRFEVHDLPGWYLGEAAGNLIRIDADAGGNGWHIGPEAAGDRVDLLTAVLHEIGHALGLADCYAEDARHDVMYGFLRKGERRLPVKGQARNVTPQKHGVSHFLTAPLNIGDLPPGKTVTITYVVTISSSTTAVTNQGTVSGTNFASKVTDDPETPAANDATVTPVNLPPTVSNVAIESNEDAVVNFALANFSASFSDPNTDSVATVRITSLPANGVLKNGSTPITSVPTDIAAASIANLNYTPNADYNGFDSFGWNGSDGQFFAATSASVNLTILPLNDPPTLNAIANPAPIAENSGQQIINLTGISPGPGDEIGQVLSVAATSSNPALIPNPNVSYASPGSTGTLDYTPLPNTFGTAVITVTVTDDGPSGSGNVNTFQRTFTVTVFEVRPLTAWREFHGLPADGSQDLSTPAGDGVPNLLKYAFNMARTAGSLLVPNIEILEEDSIAGLPWIRRNAEGKLVIDFVRRKSSSRAGVAYIVETGEDLTQPLAPLSLSSATITSIDSIWERVSVVDPTVTPNRFGRMRVQLLPVYFNDFNMGLGPAALRGTAVLLNQAVRLTDTIGGQVGAVTFSGVTVGPQLTGFTARFNMALGPGTIPPADGASFAVGDLGAGAWGEAGPATGHVLVIGFDTFNNNGAPVDQIGIHLRVNGTPVASNPTNPYTNGASVPVEISYQVGTGVTVKFNGDTIFNNVSISGFDLLATDQFGIGARTGGANQRAVIDDVEIVPR
jgi:hypothetical protein